jgi:ligand-binding SRPBCC domain-containing protein
MGPVPAVRLPGYDLQRSKTQVVLHESHRTQEVYAGARFAPFEVPAMLGALVADTSIHDRNLFNDNYLFRTTTIKIPGQRQLFFPSNDN